MIWDTVSSQTCFCWLYRASPSLASNNTINLILVLTIWWCPCVESSLVLLEEGVCYDQCILLANFVSLWPASFCTPRPNLPVTPVISWLPTFAFQSPIMKKTSFWVLVWEGLVGLHRTVIYKLALTKNIASDWTTKAFAICLYRDWTPCCYTCWPSTTPERVQSGVRLSVLQGIWWDRSLDSWMFLGTDFMIPILASPRI